MVVISYFLIAYFRLDEYLFIIAVSGILILFGYNFMQLVKIANGRFQINFRLHIQKSC